MALSSRFRRIVLICTSVWVSALLASPSQCQTPDLDTLGGVWGAELRIGMPVQGELTLDARNGAWLACISGFQVPIDIHGREIHFKLGDGLAEFRGVRDPSANDIRGQWIQQGGVVLDPQYASPIELHSIAPNVWRGTVVPLEQRLGVYLVISAQDGKRTATVTNPEGNFFRRRVYSVTTTNGNKVFLEANGARTEGTLDERAGVLSIRIVSWLPAFQFTRRTKRDAVGLYPRTPFNGAVWSYRMPLPDDDGWKTASLKAVGLNEEPLTELLHRILSADPETTSLRIQSLLIARHGQLVLEEYFYGFDEDRVHDMRSAGKTFAPVLVGIAKEHGADLTPAMPIYPAFTQYSSFANPDPRKRKVTLSDVMTMTAGNDCDDNNDESLGNEDRMQSDAAQRDWYKYTLDLPMVRDAGGENAIYCSGDLNLVGGVVATETHRWLPEFFEAYLARPLQFGRYYLNLMPSGEAYMGGGAYLRPRDQLKLGQLYLDGGSWNGKRIVSASWVADSISVHSQFAESRSLGQKHEYGYGWHIHELKSGEKTYRVFAAEGNGGQFVIVVPELDLVVGISGGSYGEFDQWYRWELELVPKYILPAAVSRNQH
jgi:CubicO group peptidase (beta-lactamase class C family)